LSERGIFVHGIRVCEEGYEQNKCVNCMLEEKREDGEYCLCNEFDVEVIE